MTHYIYETIFPSSFGCETLFGHYMNLLQQGFFLQQAAVATWMCWSSITSTLGQVVGMLQYANDSVWVGGDQVDLTFCNDRQH